MILISFAVVGMGEVLMSDQLQSVACDVISSGPLSNSKKIYVPEVLHDGLILQVPMREISVKDGASLTVYDASGPYTDAKVEIDIHRGLNDVRSSWILTRDDAEQYRTCKNRNTASKVDAHGERSKFYNSRLQRCPMRARPGRNITQLHYARRGIITPEMEYIAIRENQLRNKLNHEIAKYAKEDNDTSERIEKKQVSKPLKLITPDFVRREVAQGRAIIPANINHSELEPMIVGRNFLVKINADIVGSCESGNIEETLEKLIWSTRWGADMVMDFSVGPDADAIRDYVIRNSSVPVGTTPIYQALEKVNGVIKDLTWDIFQETLIEQAEQGIDYFSINAGMRLAKAHAVLERETADTPRGGSILAKWCVEHQQENFLYTHFDEICNIAKAYDVSISLGCCTRLDPTSSGTDDLLTDELINLGALTKNAWAQDVQVMVEGPDHIEMIKLKQNIDKYLKFYQQSPFYSYGPMAANIVPSDYQPNDNMGAAMIAWYGCSVLCYTIPQKRLVSSDKATIKEDLIAYKFAAHTADLAKRHPGVFLRNKGADAESFCSTMYSPNFSTVVGV